LKRSQATLLLIRFPPRFDGCAFALAEDGAKCVTLRTGAAPIEIAAELLCENARCIAPLGAAHRYWCKNFLDVAETMFSRRRKDRGGLWISHKNAV